MISLFTQIHFGDLDRLEKTSVHNYDATIETLLNAYTDYKQNDLMSCSDKLERIGFSASKSSNAVIPKNIRIDTLIFEDEAASKWAFFRSVDLGYLKNVSGFVTLKCENADYFLETLVGKLGNSNIHMSIQTLESQRKVVLKDTRSFIVFDNRWEEKVSSKFPSFYTYTITVLDDYVDIEFEEIVPKEYVILERQLY